MTRQLLEYHPGLGYRFIPGLRARVRHESGGYLVATNGHGFRSREFRPDRSTGLRRVLLFGDSFTAGDGVSNGRRFGDLLEQLVPETEVYNFGLPGTGTDQHYLAYREYGVPLDHDLLVVAVLVENVRRVAAPYRGFVEHGRLVWYSKPYFTLADDQLQLHNVPVRRDPIPAAELPAIVQSSHLAEITEGFSASRPVPEYDHPDGYAWRILRQILMSWVEEVHPRTVLLVPLPLFAHVEGAADPSAYQERFAELAAAAHCHLHDPLPDLLRHTTRQRREFRFGRDIHPTPAGHRALAASLAPVVEDILRTDSREDGLSP